MVALGRGGVSYERGAPVGLLTFLWSESQQRNSSETTFCGCRYGTYKTVNGTYKTVAMAHIRQSLWHIYDSQWHI